MDISVELIMKRLFESKGSELRVTLSIRTILAVLILVITAVTVQAEDEALTSAFDGQFLKMVVSIEQLTSPTNGQPIGTGFLLQTTNGHLALVTAKHVIIDDSNNIRTNLAIRLNERTNASILVADTFISSMAGKWFLSKDADLACRLITFGNTSDIKALSLDRMLSQKRMQTGAQVVVLGFPMGLRSERYAAPIARRGMVARSGDGELIIDAFVFPGNSGGPVIYTPPIKVGGPLQSPFVGTEMLAGIVVDYVPYTDVAVSPQTRRPRVSFEENSGLCHVVPTDKILEILWSDDFLKFEKSLK